MAKVPTLLFIKMFKHFDCLWKKDSPDYQNPDKTNKAYQRIAQLCQAIDPNIKISASAVQSKLRVILSMYTSELQEMQETEGKAKWRYFHTMDEFLQRSKEGPSPEDTKTVVKEETGGLMMDVADGAEFEMPTDETPDDDTCSPVGSSNVVSEDEVKAAESQLQQLLEQTDDNSPSLEPGCSSSNTSVVKPKSTPLVTSTLSVSLVDILGSSAASKSNLKQDQVPKKPITIYIPERKNIIIPRPIQPRNPIGSQPAQSIDLTTSRKRPPGGTDPHDGTHKVKRRKLPGATPQTVTASNPSTTTQSLKTRIEQTRKTVRQLLNERTSNSDVNGASSKLELNKEELKQLVKESQSVIAALVKRLAERPQSECELFGQLIGRKMDTVKSRRRKEALKLHIHNLVCETILEEMEGEPDV